MDGTLTPARKPMTEDFKTKFLPWLKTHTAFIATGSDYAKVGEQLPQEVIDEYDGIYGSMGNTLYKKGELVYKKEIEYDTNLLLDLEGFRKNTKYPTNEDNKNIIPPIVAVPLFCLCFSTYISML